MTANSLTIISNLSKRYPQLLLPIENGVSKTPEYRNAVLRGKPIFTEPAFKGSEEDSLSVISTPAGNADILYLADREDFIHAFRALAHKCEPVEIPDSVGATTVIGLINWEKINRHKEEYLQRGGVNWNIEFKRFTSDKNNCRDTLILLGRGYYSALSPEIARIEENEWLEKSLVIRKYHELTHFVCRRMYPNDTDAIRDEVLADLIGSVAAFGQYDEMLAKEFLGIQNGKFREGGRLSHYVKDNMINETVSVAEYWIKEYSSKMKNIKTDDIFSLMTDIFL